MPNQTLLTDFVKSAKSQSIENIFHLPSKQTNPRHLFLSVKYFFQESHNLYALLYIQGRQ